MSLDSRLGTLCQNFISHNLSTGNLGSLITVFLGKVSQCLELPDKESSIHVWQAFNALFIIRTLVKYMIETGSEYQLLQQFESIPIKLENSDETTNTSISVADENNSKNNLITKIVDGSKFETFFDALVSIIVVIPVK